MTLAGRRLAALIAAGLVFALDQWIKAQVMGAWGVLAAHERAMALGMQDEGVSIGLPFFRLLWTENYGVSLGLLTARSVEMRYLLIALLSAIALVVFVWMMRERKAFDLFALALVLGGALGNIRDRFIRGYVIDYADLHFGDFRPFLIFNLADVAISIGVLIILARSLFSREKPKPAAPDNAADAAPESQEHA